MNLADNIVTLTTSVRAVMTAIEGARIKLCVLVDDQGRLVRTVVDGDIRRALLAGVGLDDPVSKLPCQSVVTLPEEASTEELAAAFAEHPSINAIVLTDADNRPARLVPRSDVMSDILLSPPHIGTAESAYVRKAFDDNWIAPAGPNLDAFEGALAKVSGRNNAVALSSGTAALHLALRVLDIGPGDRVYVSDLTFAASVQPILYQAGVPVLIDAEPLTWNMSPAALERQLEADSAKGCLPKAVIVVHLYGQSANMDAILRLTSRYDIPVIEDAAESLGARYGNEPSGSHGLISAYSFNGNKIITTSGGGALVSNRSDLIDRARHLATQGRDPAQHYQHSTMAYNYRMSNVLAGIGLGQLEILDRRVARRREIFRTYLSGLSDIDGIGFQSDAPNSSGNRWLTVISLDPDRISRHPYQLLRELRTKGIESRPAWKPMHMQPIFARYHFEPHSVTDVVSTRVFLQSVCLPSGSLLEPAQQARIIDCIREFTRG